jgi:DNA-binding transcriptional LysR family regulator
VAIAIDVPGQLTLDDSDLMLVAAVGGEGLAFLSDITAAKSIEAGLLLPVLEDCSPGICGSLSLLSEPPQYSGPAAPAFVDLIRQQAR